jgi:hypothetical protein
MFVSRKTGGISDYALISIQHFTLYDLATFFGVATLQQIIFGHVRASIHKFISATQSRLCKSDQNGGVTSDFLKRELDWVSATIGHF